MNNKYEKNSWFYELIYILEWCIYVIYKNWKEILVKEWDIFLIEPNIFHEIKTSYAKIFISCTPPFNFKNIELEK